MQFDDLVVFGIFLNGFCMNRGLTEMLPKLGAAIFIIYSAFAFSGCATTPSPAMTPVTRPSNNEWARLESARANLAEKQAIVEEKQREHNSAEQLASTVQLDALTGILTDLSRSEPGRPAVAPPQAKLVQYRTDLATAAQRMTAAKSALAEANVGLSTAEFAVVTANDELGKVTRSDFDSQFTKVLGDCKRVFDEYQGNSRRGAKVAFWLQISGLIAGAVASPALVAASAVSNKAWIAGLSGYAGGTNLAESTLGTSGLNGIADANTANALATKIGSDITAALNKTNWDEKYDALDAVVADCSLFQIGVPSAPGSNGFSEKKESKP